MRIAQEEIFGPTTALIPVGSFEEAVAAANSVSYGLSSSIFTRDVNRAFRAMRDLQAGITYVNAGTTGAEVHLPFGGTKDTGNGHREAGQAALDVFTEWKSIYVDYSGSLQRAQIDNVSEPQARRLRPAGGARRRARGGLRRGRGPDRRLRALLLVHATAPARSSAGAGAIPTSASRGRERARRRGTGSRRSSRRSAQDEVVAAAARGASLRGAGLRHLRRSCEGAALHRRRRPRQSRARPRTATSSRPRTARYSPRRARRSASPRTTSPSTAASIAGLDEGGRARSRRGRGPLRLRADGQADARRVPRQERGASRALARGGAPRPAARPASSTATCGASTTSSPTGSSTRPSTPGSARRRGYTRAITRM